MSKPFKYDPLGSKVPHQDDSDPKCENKKRNSSSNTKIEHQNQNVTEMFAWNKQHGERPHY